MNSLLTLGPFLLVFLMGYWLQIKALSESSINKSLTWLTSIILGMIGFSIGTLDNLAEKLITAGSQALIFFISTSVLSITALWYTGKHLSIIENRSDTSAKKKVSTQINFSIFTDAIKTLLFVAMGILVGIFVDHSPSYIDTAVSYLLYLLLFLVGNQLQRGNHRLRKLFLNPQGLIIAFATITTTLAGGLIGAIFIGLPITDGLAVVSGFGWYSLSGIIITGLGNPILGTTAFLLDIGREILVLMLIPMLSRINNHISVGYSGVNAMDITLPILNKFHGINVVPTAITSGFIMTILVPILIPFFLNFET